MLKITLKIFSFLFLLATAAFAQSKIKLIQLPLAINSINQEYSGITQYGNRVYLLPQYGNNYTTKLKGEFNIYSFATDSINHAIEGTDTLYHFRTLKVKNLTRLPNEIVDNYQGFEAIAIANNQVYLTIETKDTHYYCYVLKGVLDTLKNEIYIDSRNFIRLRRYPAIVNAGFESLAYLPKGKKLLAYYEFNAMPNGGIAYLIDPDFKSAPKPVKAPYLYFRMTDIAADNRDRIYGINYYYNGDYEDHLVNGILQHPEDKIETAIPELAEPLNKDPDYLKKNTYARIVSLKNYKATQWEHVFSFDGYKNNWEGITLFGKGALIITDANRSNKQLSTFGYIPFDK
ncbi:MAG: hypothetical protein EOP47_08470 [Sphingobacteriaceae bacterium]|nr:MAG: hypothetical protein EOP47_08470 [Sphingobacteriaceae bacterium]